MTTQRHNNYKRFFKYLNFLKNLNYQQCLNAYLEDQRNEAYDNYTKAFKLEQYLHVRYMREV